MSEPNREKAAAHVTPEVVRQTLMDMIDIRSPTGSEAAMAEYIVDRLRRAGLDASLQPVEEGRPNAVAHLRGRGDGLNLLFTGHMDTSYSGDEDHLHGRGFQAKRHLPRWLDLGAWCQQYEKRPCRTCGCHRGSGHDRRGAPRRRVVGCGGGRDREDSN